MKVKVLVIRHFGVPFFSNANAVLVATGVLHHIVLVR